jgi:uncharacterized membrane-anchored protein
MIALLNLGRALMVVWIAYALLLMFAPSLVHRAADPIGGAIQALIAFGLGYLMDRALSIVLRRRALSAQSDPSERDPGSI